MGWYPTKVTTAPEEEPVSLELAKRQCGIPVASTGRDEELNAAIASARGKTEKYCNIRLVTQEIEMICDRFCDLAVLPDGPLQEVTSISYIDEAGGEQEVAADVYEERLDGLEPSIVLNYGKQWPGIRQGSRIKIAATAGYGEQGDVPPDIVSALLLMVGGLMSMSGKDTSVKSIEVVGIATRQYGGIEQVSAATEKAYMGLLENYRRSLIT